MTRQEPSVTQVYYCWKAKQKRKRTVRQFVRIKLEGKRFKRRKNKARVDWDNLLREAA